MNLYFRILPPSQREFWDTLAQSVPEHFVLYGGTAIALRFGHRPSIDFDFFTDRRFRFDDISEAMPAISQATVLQRAANTLVAAMPMPSGEVKLSFFGGLAFGRVGDPDELPNRPAIAAPIDLLATKLKALHDRVEARDYLDIEVLLKSGITLDQGIAAAQSLFGRTLNALDTAKAVGWFKDGGLDRKLPRATQQFLAEASARFDPDISPPRVRSSALAPTRRRECDDLER
jgi:hypothetical protein